MGQQRSRSRQPSGKPAKHTSLLERVNHNAAGIDCGSETHYVAVPPERDPDSVRSFKAFTSDLHRLADWLEACKIKTVALESTGVYWIPIFEILEERGFEVVLVNSRHIKNVPGRKTDVLDCQWIQQLHSVGLLRGSFRPAAEITSLRAYLRHREKLVQSAASHVQRMQKALVQMNLQLHNVISDITGVTGMRILRDIVSGVTDPMALAAHRDHRCRASQDEIVASLTGNYRAEHLFILREHLELFDTFQQHIQTCDGEIESLLHKLAAKQSEPKTPVPAPRSKPRFYDNEPRFEIRDPLYRLAGADLQALHLLVDARAQKQDHRRPAHQLEDAALGQPSGYRPPHVRDGRGSHLHRARRVLPTRRLQDRQAQGDHRDRPQTRHPRLLHAQGRHELQGPRSRGLRGTAPSQNPAEPAQSGPSTRLRARQHRFRRVTPRASFLGAAARGGRPET